MYCVSGMLTEKCGETDCLVKAMIPPFYIIVLTQPPRKLTVWRHLLRHSITAGCQILQDQGQGGLEMSLGRSVICKHVHRNVHES